jgi:CheY-like chemotaxis protein
MNLPSQPLRLVLVVDDDEEARTFLGESLKAGGYGVWEAPSGKAAMKILSDRRIDLVVGDASGVEPDGENTLRKLHRAQPGIKILALTGKFPAVSKAPRFVRRRSRLPLMEPGSIRARVFLGANATLPKPVSVNLLLEATRKLLGDSA